MKRLLCVCLLLIVLVSLLPLPGAAGAGEPLMLEATYRATKSSTLRHWRFPYTDDWFTKPASSYQHGLARASLGMALAAFRDVTGDMDERDVPIRRYLTDAGFEGLQSDQYDITPTIDTIATMIGRKSIGGFTLIAVAVSGGGYENEWLSNFTIGDGERHKGFNDASQKVQARIRQYLASQELTGDVKLWISGYSRAAAVSNLTAADMIDSGLFADVFGYTFATPRTTKQPVKHKSIFNIVGKFDPVPCVPFADWGYQRYGNDLYTPAQETDSDYHVKKAAADVVSRELTGQAFWNNPAINNQLHTVMDYLLGILKDSGVYAGHMQDIMIRMWQDKSINNIYGALADVMMDAELISESQHYELEELLEYLSGVAYDTAAGSIFGLPGTHWNAGAGMTDNIAHEHVPDVYVAWLFSADDPDRLFTASDAYMRFVCQGDVIVYILGADGRFLWRVDEHGSISSEPMDDTFDASLPVSERAQLFMERRGTQTILTLPKDGDYMIVLEAVREQEILYFGTEYSVNEIKGELKKLHYINAEKGKQYIAFSHADWFDDRSERLFGEEDYSYEVFDESLPYSPSVIMWLENMNVFRLTIEQTANLAVAAVVLVLAILAAVAAKIHRGHKRRKAARLAVQAAPAVGAEDDRSATVE